ncbi:DNA repair protein XRCC3 [Pseudolycoriella hygida]|uniref:DNA repair protein XRCC3 n=1 Tax=Pseudolycoriella hygida TaxID=35572 RepID=A0A9Q0RYQ1_9DIPT|nr:DNA repair protein XRCC3 [Pseudolycoriella hygida]
MHKNFKLNLENILPADLVKRLRQAKCIDTHSVLTASDAKFRKYDFSPSEVRLIRSTVSKFVITQCEPITNAELMDTNFGKWKRIRVGCRAVDEILNNGISNVGITEICGESGSGKSQICLQLAVTVQLPEHLGGLGRGAVYISTEDSVPTSRTVEIANYFRNRYGSEVAHINFSDNIYIDEVYTEKELLQCVTNRLPFLLNHSKIGLIVIDSVGAIFRISCNYIKRAEQMRDLCQTLLRLSEKHRCAVVCVNQVSSFVNSRTSTSSDDQLIPCLGLAWANLVNTRLQVHRTNKTLTQNTQVTSQPIRKIRVLFAPDLKHGSAEFIITSNGVSDIV